MIKNITKAAVLAVVAGSLSIAAAVPAQAQTTPPANGRKCSFASVTDPTIENGEVQTGQINGGPLVAEAPGATISMKCTIQVGSANSTHAGADSCSVSSAPSLQITTIPPTACSYLSPEGQPVYMCTETTVNGVTYYWDGTAWSTSSSAPCQEAISQEIFPGPAGPVLDIVFGIVDPLICPILAGIPQVPGVLETDAEGDVFVGGIWVIDCPPYGTL